MSFITKTVTAYGIEKEFLKQFIAELTSASSSIVCLTSDSSIDEQFSDNDATPQVDFKIANVLTLSLIRTGTSASSKAGYLLYTDVTGAIAATPGKVSITYMSGAAYASAQNTRTWKFLVAENDRCILLRLGDYNSELLVPSTKTGPAQLGDIIVIKSNSGTLAVCAAVGIAVSTVSSAQYSIMDAPFYIHGADIIQTSAIDRLPYLYDSNNTENIEFFNEKSFLVYNSQNKAFSTSGLCDCSTITRNLRFSQGDKKYMSVDDHTLMEV